MFVHIPWKKVNNLILIFESFTGRVLLDKSTLRKCHLMERHAYVRVYTVLPTLKKTKNKWSCAETQFELDPTSLGTPITSEDDERSISINCSILSENSENITPENIEQIKIRPTPCYMRG